MITPIKAMWITCMFGDVVGIVKTYDDITEQYKYYIGAGRGRTEHEDIQLIIKYGQKYDSLNFLREF